MVGVALCGLLGCGGYTSGGSPTARDSEPEPRGTPAAANSTTANPTTPANPTAPANSTAPANPTTPASTSLVAKYPGTGFVVHEWGTNTVVSGSDGTLQLGLHHEEEDLPPFVYDRLKAAVAKPNTTPPNHNVDTKMETPIVYFYSDRALTVHANVRFPSGILTQWYPGVAWFKPPVEWLDFNNTVLEDRHPPRDPALDAGFLITTPACEEKYRKNGVLDWGAFEVAAPGTVPPNLPVAPIEEYTWSHARDVAANFIRFPDSESERFLFYRGLSNLELPARTRAHGAGQLSLENLGQAALGAVFLIDVQGERGAFRVHPGVGATQTLALEAPEDSSFAPLPEFVEALSQAMATALDATGLYADESRAMVNTWKRQWFTTPGLRVLYLAPQTWTEQVLPLTVDPVPESLVRVMVVRVEMLTPELEAVDRAALERMSSDPAATRGHFDALGRFAEPRLRRALTAVPSAAGSSYLTEIATRVSRAGELSN